VKGERRGLGGTRRVKVIVMTLDRRRDALTQDVFNMSDIKDRYVLPTVFCVA
jgi:hypothetical protein